MRKRAKPILLFTLMFAAVALLGYGQAWAVQPACQEVQIFQNQTMIVWNPGCQVLQGVYYWKGISGDIEYDEDCDTSLAGVDCSPTNCSACPGGNCDTCWRKGQEIRMVMCTCKGSDCVDDAAGGIYENIARQGQPIPNTDPAVIYDVTVECSAITGSGPKLGCPLYLNPPRTTIGARAFR